MSQRRGHGARKPAQYPVLLVIRVSAEDKLALLAVSRRAGQPGNLSAAMRLLIAESAQPQRNTRTAKQNAAGQVASSAK